MFATTRATSIQERRRAILENLGQMRARPIKLHPLAVAQDHCITATASRKCEGATISGPAMWIASDLQAAADAPVSSPDVNFNNKMLVVVRVELRPSDDEP